MDPLEAYARQTKYIIYGAILGAVATPAAAVFLAENYYDYSTIGQIALDIAVGILGIPVGGFGGGLCGLILSDFRNAYLNFLENTKK